LNRACRFAVTHLAYSLLESVYPTSKVVSSAANAEAAKSGRIHDAWPILMLGLGAVLTLAWTIFLFCQLVDAVSMMM
jgi:hypothetical protein